MYKVEKKIIVDAPEISHDDIMSMTEAADILNVTLAAIDSYMVRGRLTAVIDDSSQTAYGNHRRLVIREEVMDLKRERDERRGKEMPVQVATTEVLPA